MKKIIKVSLLLFILLALWHSFRQFSVMKLDGDIAESVLPYAGVQKTFDDPTGIKTIINNDPHSGPNRFFSHYFLHKTFREIPLLLQNFCDPIESVYYTAAIAKLAMLIMLVFLLAVIITGGCRIASLKFLITTIILLPLPHGIGIIDKSVSYSFFYAFPLVFLLLYYIPIFFNLLHDKTIKMNWILIVLWSIFAVISCFSGPLNSPVILITNAILFFYLFHQHWQTNNDKSLYQKTLHAIKTIRRRYYLFLIPISVIALYSTFLGTYTNVYPDLQSSVKNLYLLLPEGIWKILTTTGSYSIMLLLLILNYFMVILPYKNEPQSKKILGLYRFLIAFSSFYILLLPFGGYRPYRPLLLRHDTILPVTILLIITVVYTFLFVLKHLKTEKRHYYLKPVYLAIVLLFFIFFAGRNMVRTFNDCEKSSLYAISQSKEDVVVLYNDCSVIGWEPVYQPEETKNYAELMYLWNMTNRVKLYYNAPQTN